MQQDGVDLLDDLQPQVGAIVDRQHLKHVQKQISDVEHNLHQRIHDHAHDLQTVRQCGERQGGAIFEVISVGPNGCRRIQIRNARAGDGGIVELLHGAADELRIVNRKGRRLVEEELLPALTGEEAIRFKHLVSGVLNRSAEEIHILIQIANIDGLRKLLRDGSVSYGIQAHLRAIAFDPRLSRDGSFAGLCLVFLVLQTCGPWLFPEGPVRPVAAGGHRKLFHEDLTPEAAQLPGGRRGAHAAVAAQLASEINGKHSRRFQPSERAVTHLGFHFFCSTTTSDKVVSGRWFTLAQPGARLGRQQF